MKEFDIGSDTITIDSVLDISNSTLKWPTMGSSQYTINTGPSTYSFTNDRIDYSLDVKGDANFEGDVKIKGKSIVETLEKIESRLAILQPDPTKLEKYESLRKAYEHYKTLERLIGED